MLLITKYESNLSVCLVLINPHKFISDYLYFPYNLKVTSEKIFRNWKSFKINEKWFLLHLKSSSPSQDI